MNDLENENQRLAELRAVPRVTTTVRVQSPTLPDYFATTLDVARHGMQVTTTMPLQVGDELEFSLDLPGQEILEGVGVVRWAARSKPFRAGIEFQFLSPDQDRTLERFLQNSGLPAAEDEQDTMTSEPDYIISDLEMEAIILEAIENEGQLVLTLLEENQPVQWFFPHPSRIEGHIQQDRLEALQVRPRSKDRFEFQFLGPGKTPILKFRSQMPFKEAS